MGFFQELKRRNVYRVAVAYAVVAWLLIQIATQVFPFFEIPSWAVRLVVLLLALGFPIALILAWAFELTPEGIQLTAGNKEAWATRESACDVRCSGALLDLWCCGFAIEFSPASARPYLIRQRSGTTAGPPRYRGVAVRKSQ